MPHMDHRTGDIDMSGMAGDSVMAPCMQTMMELQQRLMADPIIHQRMMADTAMKRMIEAMMVDMSPSGMHRTKPEGTLPDDSASAGHLHHAPPTPGKFNPPSARPKKARLPVTDSMPGMDHNRATGTGRP